MTDYPLKSIPFSSGLNFACLPGSGVEARFLHNEIFEDDIYLRDGIEIQEGDTVFDVGANIGMFSVYLLQKFDQINLFAFEPVPPTFQALQTNIHALNLKHPESVQLFPIGIADQSGEREITFYPTSPGNSTLFPEAKFEEAEITVDAIELKDVWKYDKAGFFGLLLFYPFRRKLIADRLKKMYSNGMTFQIQLQSLSSIIEEHQVEQIDLLKIDVEGCEFLVLEGIDEKDWGKIRQAVIEISPEHVSRVESLIEQLNAKGFRNINVETMGNQQENQQNRVPRNLYATR